MKVYLHKTPEHLELRASGPDAPGPIFVDFISGKLAHRRRFGGGRRQLIARAVGIMPKKTLTVLDATAGLGRDAYVLASLGCHVTMLECSPIISALLKDGLERAKSDPAFQVLKLQFIETDAIPYMKSLSESDRPEVIYLDPMFPDSKKSALVKKEMRLLKAAVGDHDSSAELLSSALKVAIKRVVVKRHRQAAAIEGPDPDLVFTGKSCRFDVYLRVALEMSGKKPR